MSSRMCLSTAKTRIIIGILSAFCLLTTSALSVEIEEIRQRGVLRHLAITYAHFVMETADGMAGLDVDLMRLFADHLGVRYELVKTTWSEAFGDLTGQRIRPDGDDVVLLGSTKVRGDILANGLTALPWRQKIVDYSVPTFPTGVWLMARADAPIMPIEPSGHIETDIKRVRAKLPGHSVLSMKGTCLDADLYDLSAAGADIRYHTASENLDDIAPAVLKGVAEACLLDIPDALVALQTWPGEIKVIGPISFPQWMGAAVAKSSTELRLTFDEFFQTLWNDGTYEGLVHKYCPAIPLYLGSFFDTRKAR